MFRASVCVGCPPTLSEQTAGTGREAGKRGSAEAAAALPTQAVLVMSVV